MNLSPLSQNPIIASAMVPSVGNSALNTPLKTSPTDQKIQTVATSIFNSLPAIHKL